MTVVQHFDPDYGLRAYGVAGAVQDLGPLRYGVDGRFWAYELGVWAPADPVVHRRICRLLRDRYRPNHGHAVREVLRAELDEMTVSPVWRYVNLGNGMLQWDAPDGLELLDHHPEYGSTVQLPVRWRPDASCPEFDAFLERAVAIDDRQRVWEILGYLMMSGNPLQRMFLFTGGGGNGKGVLLHVIMALLGLGNVSNVPLHDFVNDKFAAAEVFGMLANVCGDIDTGFIEETGRIKTLAGEDRIKGERKYGQPFYFDFWGKAIFSANGIPASADSSAGWTRRWEVVAFPNAPTTPDRGLKARLSTVESLEGIAVKALTALRDLMARGTFAHGDSADAVHAEFAERSNKLLLWLRESCHPDPEAWYDRQELLTAFRIWDAQQNPSAKAMSAQHFYERLRQTGRVKPIKRRGVNGFKGVSLGRDVHVIDEWCEDAPGPSPSGGGNSEIQGVLPI